MRYLDPKNDLTFKRIFADHPHLLKSFLNAVLPLAEGQEILSLEYLPAELTPQVPLFKYTIVDVRCSDNRGRQFIVEMQMLWTNSFKNRVLFNASKAYVKQLEKGEKYESLQPVYALSLVNQNFEPDTPEYYHHYQIVNVENPRQQLNGLEFVFVELPKLKAKNGQEKALGVLWLRFLAEIDSHTEQVSDDFRRNSSIKEALEILEESAFTKIELAVYDRYWDAIISEQTLIEEHVRNAEKSGMERGMRIGIEQGITQGIEQGITQGIEQGITQGIEQGIEQGKQQEKIQTALKMKQLGITNDLIAQATGLSIDFLQTL